jgi:hypothetical protein
MIDVEMLRLRDVKLDYLSLAARSFVRVNEHVSSGPTFNIEQGKEPLSISATINTQQKKEKAESP